MIHAHIYYSGTVQGVGFRFFVYRSAQGLGLSGWVRNLGDGRVEIRVEGEAEGIQQMMTAVEERFSGSIRNKSLGYGEATGRYSSFSILDY